MPNITVDKNVTFSLNIFKNSVLSNYLKEKKTCLSTMITQEILPYPVVQYNNLFPNSIDAFLELFEGILDLESIEHGMSLDFVIDAKIDNQKVNPVLRLATPHDARAITEICSEVYKGTYPYFDLMDEQAVRNMIRSPDHHFILFLVEEQIVGCFRCALNRSQKRGYMGGFMLKSPYHGIIDVVKVIIGSYVWMWSTFKDEILIWYCENRTAHAASQYITAVCGIHTIAIFPNKDIFFHEIESDVMGITYQEKALSEMRSKENPQLIEDAIDSFLYADGLYNLGSFRIENSEMELDMDKVEKLREKIKISISEDAHQYQHVSFSLARSNAFFNFLHTPHIQNLEKVEYEVYSCEEFFVFLEYFNQYMKEHQIRYSEIFISAYNSQFQKIINSFGFHARGFVPCWKYHQQDKYFEDHIIFNWYQGEVSNLDLLPEGVQLLEMIGLNNSKEKSLYS